jgi:hypothetical protein
MAAVAELETVGPLSLNFRFWPGAAFGSRPPKAAAGPSSEFSSVGSRAPRRTHTIGHERTVGGSICDGSIYVTKRTVMRGRGIP